MAKDNKTPPSVFISYSHDSVEHADRVLAFSDRLRDDGINAILDQYESAPPNGWTHWMTRHIRDADFVIMVCTETYYRRVMQDEKPGTGLGVKWEGKLIFNHLYQADVTLSRFVPVLFGSDGVANIPDPLQDANHYHLNSEENYLDLYRRLTDRHATPRPSLGKPKQLPRRQRDTDFLVPVTSAPPATTPAPEPIASPPPKDPARISLHKLPATSPDLFGRDEYLDMLDTAWNDDKTNILAFVAFGGVGKTSLVKHWLNYRMAPNDYNDAKRIFTWSFYSQGVSDTRQVSSEQFTDSALRFFDGEEMADSTASAWDKGIALAHLIGQDKNILILDGLEPLQDPNDRNRIKDSAVAALLANLAASASNKGFCIVSTRLEIENLKEFSDVFVKTIQLDRLPIQAAIELLKNQGAKGTDEELKQAANDYVCHALALMLLGSYIKTAYKGDIRQRDRIPHLTDEKHQGEHAKHVMGLYNRWFKGKPELQILRILGIFDRPTKLAAVDAIKTGIPIKGLTSKLGTLSDYQWQSTLEHLREVNLLLPSEQDKPDVLDCHPLIRDYFGEILKQTKPASWKKAHSRLYEYFKNLPEKDLPNTIEEMTPLYRAVYHGCAAGLHQQALKDIYIKRIQRSDEHFHWHQLGAYSADLATVTCFFKSSWHEPSPNLADPLKGFILNETAYDLRALGRLAEAAKTFKAATNMAIAQEDWNHAGVGFGNLSEIYLILGKISVAIDYGRQSVDLADKTGDAYRKIVSLTTLADALAQSGRIDDAQKLFAEAEKIQKDHQPYYPFLYTLRGYQYCDLLLDRAEFNQVITRATQTIEIAIQCNWILYIALDNLSLGSAFQQKTLTEKTDDFTNAIEHLNTAVNDLRKAGTLHHIPWGILARAEYYRDTKDFDAARRDLDEAYALSTRCGMKLHQADCCLEYTCLYLAEGDTDNARQYFKEAESIITETGYHRRDKDLDDLRPKLT